MLQEKLSKDTVDGETVRPHSPRIQWFNVYI